MLFYIVVFTFKKETEPIFFSFVKRVLARTHTHVYIMYFFFYNTELYTLIFHFSAIFHHKNLISPH